MLRRIFGKKSRLARSKLGRKWIGEVKQLESNPLRQELARSQHDEPHPDADMLTALAEDSLLERERQQILAHLAACAECREILGTAAGAALDSEDDFVPLSLPRPAQLPPWRWLPWGKIASCILVFCLAVLFYQRKPEFPPSTEVATKEAVQLPSPALQQQPSPSAQKQVALGAAANRPLPQPLPQPSRSQAMNAANIVRENQFESAKSSESSSGGLYQPSAVAGQIEPPAEPVLKAAPAPSAPAFVNTITARSLSSASITAAARSHWRIDSAGHPERSFGDGAWQAVLPHETVKMRVVSVLNSEVWIGGDRSRLYHSTDSGTTWNLIALPAIDGKEHSIAHIRFQTAQSGTVESDDGTVWTTNDGGKTWK
jgi:hypothetical protein